MRRSITQERDAWFLPLVWHMCWDIALASHRCASLFQRRCQSQSNSSVLLLFPSPVSSTPVPHELQPFLAASSCSMHWTSFVSSSILSIYLRLSSETTNVLVMELTRRYVCCHLSGFCLCRRETLERVNERQRAACSKIGTHFSRSLALCC